MTVGSTDRFWRPTVAMVLGTALFFLAGTRAGAEDKKVEDKKAEDKKAENTAIKPAPKDEKRHEGFLAVAKKGGIEVLFLGDSITDGWRGRGKEVWNKNFEPLKAANF